MNIIIPLSITGLCFIIVASFLLGAVMAWVIVCGDSSMLFSVYCNKVLCKSNKKHKCMRLWLRINSSGECRAKVKK